MDDFNWDLTWDLMKKIWLIQDHPIEHDSKIFGGTFGGTPWHRGIPKKIQWDSYEDFFG